MSRAVWRVRSPGAAPRLARGDTANGGPDELLADRLTVAALLADGAALLAGLAELPAAGPVPADVELLAPVDAQPVWAAGVTYPRSRDARMEEALDGGDVYDRVFAAERPELFVKAQPGAAVGPGGTVGIRADSTWDVPEPELAVVADPEGVIRAVTLGNDMSSRSIEGANPLYLPQAKVYDRSCALGPALVPVTEVADWRTGSVELRIVRDGVDLFAETVDLATIRRTPEELVTWLFAAASFPNGVVLLTGTSMVPPADLTLAEGDRVTISSGPLGMLQNTVVRVGHRV